MPHVTNLTFKKKEKAVFDQMKRTGIELVDIQDKLPCSMDIFNAYQVNYTGDKSLESTFMDSGHMSPDTTTRSLEANGQLYIKGHNKLISEIKHAVTIPEYDRRLIS